MWLAELCFQSREQVGQITSDEKLQRVLSGGCNTAIIGPEGNHLCPPITEGEGMAIADLDFSLITKRKRMMDAVGHYSRPDLLQLRINTAAKTVTEKISEQNLICEVVGEVQTNQQLVLQSCQHDGATRQESVVFWDLSQQKLTGFSKA